MPRCVSPWKLSKPTPLDEAVTCYWADGPNAAGEFRAELLAPRCLAVELTPADTDSLGLQGGRRHRNAPERPAVCVLALAGSKRPAVENGRFLLSRTLAVTREVGSALSAPLCSRRQPHRPHVVLWCLCNETQVIYCLCLSHIALTEEAFVFGFVSFQRQLEISHTLPTH